MKSVKGITRSEQEYRSRAPRSRPVRKELSPRVHGVQASILNLQQTRGNRFVQRFIESGKMPCEKLCAQDGASRDTRRTPHSCDNCPFHARAAKLKAAGSPAPGGVIQPKVAINKPGDVYEKEADRVADSVLQSKCETPGCEEAALQPETISAIQPGSFVQKQEDSLEDEEPEEDNTLQEKEDTALAPDETENRGNGVQQILQQKGTGKPLEAGSRRFMEARFGYDFGGVRIHTDSQAARISRQLGAKAFTHGRDIYFGTGRYEPGVESGQRLLAHELTHVVQQTGKQALARQNDEYGRDK